MNEEKRNKQSFAISMQTLKEAKKKIGFYRFEIYNFITYVFCLRKCLLLICYLEILK